MRLGGYIRVSRVGGRGGDSYITKQVQRDRIEAWAKLSGAEIVSWYEDEDRTGGTMERPALADALEAVRTKAVDGIAVAYVDRFSRAGVGDALKVIEEIHERGGKLAAIDLGVDPTTPTGEFAMTMMLGLARMQRRRIGENWLEAQTRAIERGVHIGPTPVGYTREKGQPLELSDEAPFVHELFVRRAAGVPWADLARWFTDVVPPKRGRRWAESAVVRVVRNRVYLGEAYHGKALVNAEAHPAIVTPAEHRDANRSRGVAKPSSDEWLLSGLVRCAGCRYLLRGQRGTTKRDGEKVRVRSYSCRTQHSAGACPDCAAILAETLEPWVVEQALERHPDEVVRGIEATEGLSAAEDAAAEQLETIENLYRLQATAKRPELAQEAIREAEAVLEKLEVERDALRLAQAPKGAGVFSLRDLWPDWTVDERRGALSQMIEAVVVRRHGQGRWSDAPVDERALIVWKGDGIDLGDLPSRGRYVDLAGFDWDELRARVAAAHHRGAVEG